MNALFIKAQTILLQQVAGLHFTLNPLYPETRENPYKIFRKNTHHYTVLTREDDVYTLKAIDINGKVIDTVTTSLKSVLSNKKGLVQ